MGNTTTASPAVKLGPHARWGILAMLLITTTINYADRTAISIAGPEMKQAPQLSPVGLGYIFSAFDWSYVAAQLPGGWLLDKYGSKMMYFFSIFLGTRNRSRFSLGH